MALLDVVALAPWGSPSFRLLGANAEVFERLPANLHEALVREYVSTASGPGLRADVLGEPAEPWLSERGQAAFYRQIAQADQRYTDEIENRFGELARPVLVCWGTADTWLPPDRAANSPPRIPGADLRLLDGAGHLVQLDTPAQVTAALTEFLSGQRA